MSGDASSRLAAVWFADIVGYSEVASRDESSALRLVDLLRSLLDEVLGEHRGRLVKGTGDGALLLYTYFPTIVESFNSFRISAYGWSAYNPLVNKTIIFDFIGWHVILIQGGKHVQSK